MPQIIWLKDGIVIQFNKRVTLGNYGKSLTIWKVNFEDGGNYTCEISNGVGLPESYNILLDVMGRNQNNIHSSFNILLYYEKLLL